MSDLSKIELSNAEVFIKKELTWGDEQKVQGALMSGAKMSGKASQAQDMGVNFDASAMLEAKYVALECAVVEIKVNGESKKFSREWMDNLSVKDGNKLMEEVDKLSKKNQ